MKYELIDFEVEDNVATIWLNRPEVLNAMNGPLGQELLDAFDRVDADDDIRAVVMTGRGRGFCAGADLSGGGNTFARGGGGEAAGPDNVPRDGGGVLSLRIFDLRKPIIAAVNGAAVGVGVTMTLPMDIRIASENARFGFVFARRGIVMEACSSWFLPRLVGMQQAAEWVYTGRIFSAQDALEAGLVRSVHPPEDLLPAAYELAQEIAENAAPVSVALCRQMMWRMLCEDHPMYAHRVDSRGVLERGRSADAREGVEAFLQKREAHFPLKVSQDLPNIFPTWSPPDFL